MHCLDVPFFFDCLDADHVDAIAGDQPPQGSPTTVHGDAVAFVRDGDPGWPRFTDATGDARVYDVPSTVAADGYASVRPLLEA